MVTVLSFLPPSDSLSLSSGYCSFLHCAWAPGDFNNHCTIFALWLVTIHVYLRHTTLGYWALEYKCFSKVCHVHVVLSTLYQEKMVTEQEMEKLKQAKERKPCNWPLDCVVKIQCTKPPDVVKRTAELLAEVGHDGEGKRLKGQWVCSVYCCFSVVMSYLQWTIAIDGILFSSYI